jgi:tRNA G18 (ribose-2'-O)-methylase SpoU
VGNPGKVRRTPQRQLLLMVEQVRHKPFAELSQTRELLVACSAFRSNVNLSRLVRLAGCVAIPKIILCGPGKVDPTIARDAADHVVIERRRTLAPALKELAQQGYRLVGLEQADRSVSLFEFQFPRKMVLVIGNERNGIEQELLSMMQDVVEIPVYGPPHAYNVVTAATMAIYEYCKQFPQ